LSKDKQATVMPTSYINSIFQKINKQRLCQHHILIASLYSKVMIFSSHNVIGLEILDIINLSSLEKINLLESFYS